MAFAQRVEATVAAPKLTIAEVAREAALEEPNKEAATTLLMRRVKGNAPLSGELMRQGARYLIEKANASIRGAMENEHLNAQDRGLRRHEAALAGRISLYDWRMPVTGKALGDATVQDLTVAAEYHDARAKGETERVKTYRLLQERLAKSNRQTVREAFKEDELARLMQGVQQ